MELAGLSHGRRDTELPAGQTPRAPNQHRAERQCEKEGKKPLTEGFAPASPALGTVWLLRLLSVTQQPQLSPAPAGLAPLAAALGAREEEQLFLLFFFFLQALTPPSPGLCPAEHPAHASPEPKPAKAGVSELLTLPQCFLHHRKEGSRERQLSLPGKHCSNSESCRSREKPQL